MLLKVDIGFNNILVGKIKNGFSFNDNVAKTFATVFNSFLVIELCYFVGGKHNKTKDESRFFSLKDNYNLIWVSITSY